MFKREILNQNRTLTMSNNRKCDYLIMRVAKDETTFMATRIDESTKDIVLVKTIKNKSIEEVVEEATKLSYEFGITKILGKVDRSTVGIVIRDCLFSKNKDLMYSEISSSLFLNSLHIIKTEINESQIRFLQCPESALNSYKKPFLGYSEIINYHNETSLLIDELCDSEMNENRLDDYFNKKKDSYRLECLAMLYHYLKRQMFEEIEDRAIQLECIKKNMTREIHEKIFLKYIFKAIKTENTQIIFFLNNTRRFKENLVNLIDTSLNQLFLNEHFSRSILTGGNKIFNNGSTISFINSKSTDIRGRRCDYLILDSALLKEDKYKEIAFPLLHNSKVENNIEFLDMED